MTRSYESTDSFDVAVIGAGVMGAWTAYHFQRAGARVALLDRYGPANSRSSSGGESRIIRMGYGPDELYTRSARKSFAQWLSFFEEIASNRTTKDCLRPLFHRTGVLWLAREHDSYSEATALTLRNAGVRCERLDHDELRRRYPQLQIDPTFWGLLEPESGILMARQAVQAVVAHTVKIGTTYLVGEVSAPTSAGKLNAITTGGGKTIRADNFIFACGPWLPKLFPQALGKLIHVTRQEVFFLGLPAKASEFCCPDMPTWIDFNDLVYGIPDVDGRGFKIAIDKHGPEFDPNQGERLPTSAGITAMREFLAKRVPALKDQPIIEARVCQYENTSNGDFLVDRHPEFQNVWLVGGGSGHGFKHGPAVGGYVFGLITRDVEAEPRFSLATKATHQHREVY